MLIFIIVSLLLLFFLYTKYYIFFKGVLKHPILSLKTIPRDIHKYYKYKLYNNCTNYGYMNLYTSFSNQVFGCGKTLTMVKDAINLYNRYDGKLVYDFDKQEFVEQKVHIISNIKLFGVPYFNFIDEHQFTEFDKFKFPEQDIAIFLIDEIQALYDSRGFKDNLSSDFMRIFLQCRKNKVIILGTAQRFSRCDKFLREMVSTVIACDKTYRFIRTRYFNAMSVEHCEDITMLQPDIIDIWFSTDNDYQRYDTKELVEKLKKTEYISDNEILNYRGGDQTNEFLTKRFLKKNKKRKGA